MQANVQKATPQGIARAAQILRDGGLVAFATETVYGLGADAGNAAAIAKLYAAKGRPSFNPLIAHVATREEAQRLVKLPRSLTRLTDHIWPGPLTVIGPKMPDCPVCDLATSGLNTLAVRVPANPTAQALLCEIGGPICAPSANLSGRPSPTTAGHVEHDLGDRIDMVLDGGRCTSGLESTILGLDAHGRMTLLRPGALPVADLEALAGEEIRRAAFSDQDAPLAPGQLASHYAPDARLRLDATDIQPGEALIAFGPVPAHMAQAAIATLNLSEKGCLTEAATNLFAILREVDTTGANAVAVMPIPASDLGHAIRDRLSRAAAPRT